MACFHPLFAWQREDGKVIFGGTAGEVSKSRDLVLPCGKCIGCRLDRVRAWALRCVHESRMHTENCFVTLTLDDEHWHPSLDYSEFQLFMKRARRKLGPFRFFMCGEYGDLNWRPHYHALFFGKSFHDGKQIGESLFSSETLSDLWGKGICSFGAITFQSAAYVASYSLKKVSGDRAEGHYTRVDPDTGEVFKVVPEFSHMSLKPGIGYTWFQRYWRDVYLARDGVCAPGGRIAPSPRYYDKLLSDLDDDLLEVKKAERYERSLEFAAHCTQDRLLVREACAIAKRKFLRRPL